MNPPSILVAYPTGGEPSALDLLESLSTLGSVLLRPYPRLRYQVRDHKFDVALCIVVDKASITEAHELQQRLKGVPTIVVDNASGQSIPVNGFSGLVPPASPQIVEAVREYLRVGDSEPSPKSKAKPVRLTSRFDGVLSRLGGLSQNIDAPISAAARHLAWELRADRAEACIVDAEQKFHCVFSAPTSEQDPIPSEPFRVLKSKGRLVCLADLGRKSDGPLLRYLNDRGLNVMAPITLQDEIIGWLAFGVEDSLLTDEFLDDLHIATHLLSLSLSPSRRAAVPEEGPWNAVLTSFATTLLIIGADGTILDGTGETSLIGGVPKLGQSFKTLRRGRIREVIAEALRGKSVTEKWTDTHLDAIVACTSLALDDGSIAVRLCLETNGQEPVAPEVELASLLASLPVPVVSEGVSGSSPALPEGKVTSADSEIIRRCADTAKSKNIKSLRLRYSPNGATGRAVMFFETSNPDATSQLEVDISTAIKFDVTPT